ncbi:Mitochondrial ribosomal protein s18 [Mycena indigotica]|uniref:Small ribosomal subunit protein bS18m n=1 Tax=Mycena indigotica TaxID=2126181 RepID=A0A8H6SP45_9AGAR|nr:Mitochondrial ribosomal protein s18 [Mycena indigotica]KAF7301812.1 Mitochondrial ribosomal protein s18 [Mycena indigotica]
MLRRLLYTTARRHNDSIPSMNNLTDVLLQTHEDQQTAKDEEAKGAATETIQPIRNYKNFEPNDFIRPWDLSLEGRTLTPPRATRRLTTAPRTRDARSADVFYNLGIDPLKLALHPGVLDPFITELAMILPRRTTGLTSKSQRRVAKAIRRAKMMGIMPLHSEPTELF